MTLSEFKAWFEGFTEDLNGTPNAKQWKRIKARIKEIDGAPITYPVYIDRWRPYVTWWQAGCTGKQLSGGNDMQQIYNSNVTANALMDAGRAEFKAVA